MAKLAMLIRIFIILSVILLNIESYRFRKRSFVVDYENDCFLKDGKYFRYVSGTMHYFRVPPEYWFDRLTKMRAAGLNAVQTYIEWNSHEPEQLEYNFDGINDVVRYIKTAQSVGLLVILRLGPYIDAERDMGGLPYWLLRNNPEMKLRANDSSYLKYVTRWYDVLLPKLMPLIYANGGPVIMMQIENEYGSYPACDFAYTSFLRDYVRSYVGDSVVLYTTDGNSDSYLKCGKVDNVLATIDFGSHEDPVSSFAALRNHQQHGPLVNSEYYTGWIDHWAHPHSKVDYVPVINTLEKMLDMNASVNLYVFEGGTSFGFTSGANYYDNYQPNPTSYDFDAPLTEAGDPTKKYFYLRKTIGKLSFGPIHLKQVYSLFEISSYLKTVTSLYPLSFEALSVRNGFVVYTTTINVKPSDPAVLTIDKLNDRALVLVDYEYQGTMSRMEFINTIPINAKNGSQLDIIVENQGRICYGSLINELKGIVSNVTLGPVTLVNWIHRAVPEEVLKNVLMKENNLNITKINSRLKHQLPHVYRGIFVLANEEVKDTFLSVNNWRKGFAVLNGNNLGRYWPAVGPQETLYVPSSFLNPYPHVNNLFLFELEYAPCENIETCLAYFANDNKTRERSFVIDYENNCFLKDGKYFRYVSGSMHYFRVPPEYWFERLTKMRAAGLNAVQTYIEWNSHEPEELSYNFTGANDFVQYIRTAQEVGLLVILRIGPFIDAERDMGGFPYWLLRNNPNMKLRTSDPTYVQYVKRWFGLLLPKIVPLIYANGGPVIMIQIENEYGSYGCDFSYTSWLRDYVRQYVGNDVVLFTTDGDGDYYLKCGKIDGVYATIDFGVTKDPAKLFLIQRNHEMRGPFVNSEFYPGWLDHWTEPHQTVPTDAVVDTLEKMLALNASVNIYLFEGGTSFGFTSGANLGSTYQPNPTSYDYDAPLTEAGDPTEKYFAIRKVVGKYLPLPHLPLPNPSPKLRFGPVYFKKLGNLFQMIEKLETVSSFYPLTFEALSARNGFVLYTTTINVKPSDPAVLHISELNDRALVFVDYEYQGTMSSMEKVFTLPIIAKNGSRLDIFVENQGRICAGNGINKLKGIVSKVTLGPVTLLNWSQIVMTEKVILDHFGNETNFKTSDKFISHYRIPEIYKSVFTLPEGDVFDTFLNVNNWRKGVAVINNRNLGRYWPAVGPQETLYVPAPFLKPFPELNELILFELEDAPCYRSETCSAQFVDQPSINATTPYA
ncbi:hypothetical protein B4U79_11152 [Dinothrombium tinctorium]|uniref:Beta-galactosidase n=1 Tax=Dinothrombium tinctorium TaxID=1965070 RepID=A0A3S3PP31_9ACAR|nr:hypothetical protein B4U79_03852 [Dinothrombium tinctorium]RWS12989.1 hypothetical protein B4U79_02842 [Dinothrombium tinctorium]RWS13655.1 hypothetical protein B4U79_08944 [Dinothrombium tinctorium]RWS14247.1 hypothetical protein B4U79_11152 [Dinothrombium tinctorium]